MYIVSVQYLDHIAVVGGGGGTNIIRGRKEVVGSN